MKLLYILCLFSGGCAAPKIHNTPTLFAPSVKTVKSNVTIAETAVKSAAESNNRLTKNIDSSYDYASRIDAKAEVILRNWSKTRERSNLSE